MLVIYKWELNYDIKLLINFSILSLQLLVFQMKKYVTICLND